MLATATFSLGGIAGTTTRAAAQETDPLQIEDVSVSARGMTVTLGSATFSFDDGRMEFEASDVTIESETRSISVGRTLVAADGVDAETYATLRSAMVEAFGGRSMAPLVTALGEVDVNPDAQVGLLVDSVEMNGQLVFDRLTAVGTVDSVVPGGARALVQDGPTLEELMGLGASEWTSATIQREGSELTLNNVAIQRDGTTLSITSANGEATVSNRTFELGETELAVLPPETIPSEHVSFASQVREAAGDGDLTVSEVSSAAEESGVTVSNTLDAAGSSRFALSLAEVTEGGEVVVSDFQTSGTLAELLAALRQQA